MLIRNRHPRSLDNPTYTQFRSFLVDKLRAGQPRDNAEEELFEQQELEQQEQIQTPKEFCNDEKLPELTAENVKAGYQTISKELLISEEKVTEILTALTSGSHVLLAGPNLFLGSINGSVKL